MNVNKLIKSFNYAFQGICTASLQQNMRVHVVCAILVVIAGFVTGLSPIEWSILVIVIAAVISLEMMNTAIEAVVDLASPTMHPLAKVAKDVAAGSVFVFAVASVIIGGLIFFPKWF